MPKPEPYYVHREDWLPLPPQSLPRETYWPAAMALAIMMLFWGLITSAILACTGVALLAVALVGWIQELRHGGNHHAE